MEAKGKGGTASYNTVDTWSEEEKREYEEVCEEFNVIRSSQRAWLRFLGGES